MRKLQEEIDIEDSTKLKEKLDTIPNTNINPATLNQPVQEKPVVQQNKQDAQFNSALFDQLAMWVENINNMKRRKNRIIFCLYVYSIDFTQYFLILFIVSFINSFEIRWINVFSLLFLKKVKKLIHCFKFTIKILKTFIY